MLVERISGVLVLHTPHSIWDGETVQSGPSRAASTRGLTSNSFDALQPFLGLQVYTLTQFYRPLRQLRPYRADRKHAGNEDFRDEDDPEVRQLQSTLPLYQPIAARFFGFVLRESREK